ncbi:hypothetical protein Pmani_036047 [Petrolisthes manimaculis]|uniref:Uncharacterized protein n=1 Tax=Petrolisthes manimaculis TaxID=1843537 RepID=A0AAE1NJJ0_9EUCA|nr:hypothetical protein Pmani_036047 [Petrolisthes manimaculis]
MNGGRKGGKEIREGKEGWRYEKEERMDEWWKERRDEWWKERRDGDTRRKNEWMNGGRKGGMNGGRKGGKEIREGKEGE